MCVVTERAQLKAKKTPKRESRMYKAWNDKTGVYNDCYKERWSDSLPSLVQILILIVAWRRCGNKDLRPALLQRYIDLFGRTIDLLLMQVLQLWRRRGKEAIRRRRHCRRQRLWPELLLLLVLELVLVQLMQL